ncbi:MazG family protein [Rhodococcus aerolatus]
MRTVQLDPHHPDLLPASLVPLLGVARAEDGVHPAVAALCTGGPDAEVVVAVGTGRPLDDAVAVMDRLRSPGGCPWDAAQTHATLRRYLVEETYELLDALDAGDRDAVLEELGDVLLQVLFHARVAAEGTFGEPFDVDDVAAGLVVKLVGRHPHVFGGGEHVADAAAQELRWDELKAVEKQRTSAVDGVALAQPALALAAKLGSRAVRAGVPEALLPPGVAGVDGDAEDALRRAALAFAADVRAAELSARAAGLDPAALTAADWHTHWPR